MGAADGQKVTAPQCLEMTDRGGRVRGSRRGAWLAVGSTVAAVLLIFSVIFLWGRRDDMAGKRFGGGLPIGGYKASPSVPADADAESIARAAMRDRRANWSGVPITPVVWLGEASGPEMEAILDLWNDDPRQPTKVQF